jgi:hypothetical protein
LKENEKKPFKAGNAKTLIETLGKGHIIDNPSEADYILVGSSDKEKYKPQAITWNKLIDMIPGVVEPDIDRKSVKFSDNQKQQQSKKRQVDSSNDTSTSDQPKKSKRDSTTTTSTSSPSSPSSNVLQGKLKRKTTD